MVIVLIAAASQRFLLHHTPRLEQCLLYLAALGLSLHVCLAGMAYFVSAAVVLLFAASTRLVRGRRSMLGRRG